MLQVFWHNRVPAEFALDRAAQRLGCGAIAMHDVHGLRRPLRTGQAVASDSVLKKSSVEKYVEHSVRLEIFWNSKNRMNEPHCSVPFFL